MRKNGKAFRDAWHYFEQGEKIKILSVDGCSENELVAWIEDQGFYKKVKVNMDNGVEELHRMSMKEYRDYDHFWNVMGKFNPYTDFLIQPPDVGLTYDNLAKIRNEVDVG